MINNYDKQTGRRSAAAGADESVYGDLYRQYAGEIYRFLLSRLSGDRETAEDILQETFVRAFRYRKSFGYKGFNYRAYLYTIARRLLANYYRRPKPLSLEELERQFVSSQSVEDTNMRREIWEALNSLSSLERKILLMKYREGCSIRKISEEVDKSENAVKLILSRAREKIRKRVGLDPKRRSV